MWFRRVMLSDFFSFFAIYIPRDLYIRPSHSYPSSSDVFREIDCSVWIETVFPQWGDIRQVIHLGQYHHVCDGGYSERLSGQACNISHIIINMMVVDTIERSHGQPCWSFPSKGKCFASYLFQEEKKVNLRQGDRLWYLDAQLLSVSPRAVQLYIVFSTPSLHCSVGPTYIFYLQHNTLHHFKQGLSL